MMTLSDQTRYATKEGESKKLLLSDVKHFIKLVKDELRRTKYSEETLKTAGKILPDDWNLNMDKFCETIDNLAGDGFCVEDEK